MAGLILKVYLDISQGTLLQKIPKFPVLTIVIVLLFLQIGLCQEKTLAIKEFKTDQPIPFATFSINLKRYFSADSNGRFIFSTLPFNQRDTIRISALGYQSQIWEATNLLLPETIFLRPNVIQLDEVSIGQKKYTKTKLSIPSYTIYDQYATFLNSKYAVFIPNLDNKIGYISELEYHLTDNSHGIEMPFKANVYSKSSTKNIPDKALIEDDLIVFNPKRKRKVVVDISKYNIDLPKEGFFIVLEILSNEYYSREKVYTAKHFWTKTPGISITKNKYKDGSYSVRSIGKGSTWFHFDNRNFLFTANILSR